MKNAKLNNLYLIIFGLVVLFFDTASLSKGNTLSITNKTQSDIDEIHLNGGGDLIGDYEILHPNETIEVDFNCSKYNATTKIKVHLVFDDGKTHSYEDVVCRDGKNWNIEDDGNN